MRPSTTKLQTGVHLKGLRMMSHYCPTWFYFFHCGFKFPFLHSPGPACWLAARSLTPGSGLQCFWKPWDAFFRVLELQKLKSGHASGADLRGGLIWELEWFFLVPNWWFGLNRRWSDFKSDGKKSCWSHKEQSPNLVRTRVSGSELVNVRAKHQRKISQTHAGPNHPAEPRQSGLILHHKVHNQGRN